VFRKQFLEKLNRELTSAERVGEKIQQEIEKEWRVLTLVLENTDLRPREYVKLYENRFGKIGSLHINTLLSQLSLGDKQECRKFQQEFQRRWKILEQCLESSVPPKEYELRDFYRGIGAEGSIRSMSRMIMAKIVESLDEVIQDDSTLIFRGRVLSVSRLQADQILRSVMEDLLSKFGMRNEFEPRDTLESIFGEQRKEVDESIEARLQRVKDQFEHKRDHLEADKKQIDEDLIHRFLSKLNTAGTGFFLNLLFHSIRAININRENIPLLVNEIQEQTGMGINPVLDWFHLLVNALEEYGLVFYLHHGKQECAAFLKEGDLPVLQINFEESFQFDYHGSHFQPGEIKTVRVVDAGWLYRDNCGRDIILFRPTVEECSSVRS